MKQFELCSGNDFGTDGRNDGRTDGRHLNLYPPSTSWRGIIKRHGIQFRFSFIFYWQPNSIFHLTRYTLRCRMKSIISLAVKLIKASYCSCSGVVFNGTPALINCTAICVTSYLLSRLYNGIVGVECEKNVTIHHSALFPFWGNFDGLSNGRSELALPVIFQFLMTSLRVDVEMARTVGTILMEVRTI